MLTICSVSMAVLCSRAGHYFALWFLLLSFYLLFFPRLISAVEIGCLPYLHTWCGLSANLGRRYETCCRRLAENTGRKKSSENRHLGTIAQHCRAIFSQLRRISTIGKNLLSINISSTSPHNMVTVSYTHLTLPTIYSV